MKIEVLLTETEIAEEFAEALQARDLPEKCFYLFPRSIREWLELSKNGIYDDLRRSWPTVVERIAEHSQGLAPVISFGAGDGSRDRQLLQALHRAGREVKYFPVDASMALLEIACAAAEDIDIDTLGIKADISSPMHLVLASDAAESPKILLMVGNTMGAFDPLDQIRHLAQCLHEGDRLVVDGEIFDEQARSPSDEERARRFAFAPLAGLGVDQEDGEVRFEHKRDERHEGLHLITRHFRAERDLRITTSTSELLVERGERIGLNFQYLYSPAAFRWLLEKHARLRILDVIPSSGGKFLTAVCAR